MDLVLAGVERRSAPELWPTLAKIESPSLKRSVVLTFCAVAAVRPGWPGRCSGADATGLRAR